MMGINDQMLKSYISENNCLPEAIYRGSNYFNSWHELF